MQGVRIMPFLPNLHLLFLSRNIGQCSVSPVLEQLLGVCVTTHRPFPLVASSNDFLFGGRPRGLSTGLASYNNLSAVLLENFNRVFDFSWEWKADLHSDDITAMNLLCIYLQNELILLNTIGRFSWASGIAQ